MAQCCLVFGSFLRRSYCRYFYMILLITTLFILISAYSINKQTNVSKVYPIKNQTDASKSIVNIAFIVFGNFKLLKPMLYRNLLTLMDYSTIDVTVHVICDESSKHDIETMYNTAIQSTDSKIATERSLQIHDLESMKSVLRLKIKNILSFYREQSKSSFVQDGFFFSLIAHHFFPDLVRLILVDIDLIFKADIAELFSVFDDFTAEQVIGLAREQQPVYRHIFSTYRSINPGTLVGDPPPDGITGFNSGVVLLDLAKIRSLAGYRSLFSVKLLSALSKRYSFRGHLGDQDFYTLLSVEFAQYFYVLPCQWNRQLCKFWKQGYESVFQLYNSCGVVSKIIHGNCKTEID